MLALRSCITCVCARLLCLLVNRQSTAATGVVPHYQGRGSALCDSARVTAQPQPGADRSSRTVHTYKKTYLSYVLVRGRRPASKRIYLMCWCEAGALPAQLLPGLLQQVGGARQEDVPHLPASVSGQVGGQSAHQHRAHLRHSHGQARRAPGRCSRRGGAHVLRILIVVPGSAKLNKGLVLMRSAAASQTQSLKNCHARRAAGRWARRGDASALTALLLTHFWPR